MTDFAASRIVFQDRREAGRRLASALEGYRTPPPVVLALPRGGVPVAAEVASALGGALDLVIARKVGVPWQPELAMGAVVDAATPIVVRNEQVIAFAGVSEADFQAVSARELAEVRRRRALYLGERPPVRIEGRVVIVIDDGVATGASARAALRAVRAQRPKTLVLAAPVIAPDTLASLRADADDVVCLAAPENFSAVGFHYVDFRQTTDEEVIRLLGGKA